MKYHVMWNAQGSRVALIAIAIWLVGACSTPTAASAGLDGALEPDCRSFGRENVQAVRWSPAGDFLAVATTGEGYVPRIRVLGWPGMDLFSEATTDALDPDDAAIDDHGAAYWLTRDPFTPDAPTRLWRLEPGGAATIVEGNVRRDAYIGLTWAGGGFVSMAYDPGPPARSRLVRVDPARTDAEPVALTEWTARIVGEEWADPTGEWLVWDEYDAVGEPQDFVVQHDGTQKRVRPPGYGGRAMTLSPDRTFVIYQRSETARLTLLNLESGELDGELSDLESFGGEVSSRGILAALTAHGPWEPNELCTLDVNARLAARQ